MKDYACNYKNLFWHNILFFSSQDAEVFQQAQETRSYNKSLQALQTTYSWSDVFAEEK